MNLEKTHPDDAVNIAPDIHTVIFEDDKLRVLKVTVQPGAKAKMHWHPRNINYITGSSKLQFTKPDGSTAKVTFRGGEVTSSPEGSHAVENVGNTVVCTIQVEMKS